MGTLSTMTAEAYTAFVAFAIDGYARSCVAAGRCTSEESIPMATTLFAKLLPLGQATPGNYFFNILADEGQTDAGFLWFAERELDAQAAAYLFDLYIKPEQRRRGLAKIALLEMEDQVRALGLIRVALNVFDHNPGAYALYAQLGYAVASSNEGSRIMCKQLVQAD